MNVTELSKNALLAEASYTDLEGLTEDEQVEDALKLNGVAGSQAAELILEWRVAHHLPNTESGFSATLFESKDNPGQYTLAIRGTEPLTLEDLISADLWGIVTRGYARDQIYSLYQNRGQRTINPNIECP